MVVINRRAGPTSKGQMLNEMFDQGYRPNVQSAVRRVLDGVANVHLLPPQDYLPFVYLMMRASVILTDSGGIQEEAPALGKPVFVMRNVTERPEAVEAGTVRLVGTDRQRIFTEVSRVLTDDDAYAAMSGAHNPYGDGRASQRITDILLRRSPPPFVARRRGAAHERSRLQVRDVRDQPQTGG